MSALSSESHPPPAGPGEEAHSPHDSAIGLAGLGCWRVLLLLLFGFAVRAAFLLGTETLEFAGDQSRYVFHAAEWLHFGVYSDSQHFLWPPGYPFLLARAMAWAGADGLELVRWVQVGLSPIVGLCVMWLAGWFFGPRAAGWAGVGWACYLPLAVYSGLLWPETLFLVLVLPSICLAVTMCGRAMDAFDGVRAVWLGISFGLAMYLKESTLPIALAVVVGLTFARRRGPWLPRMVSTALVLATMAAVVLPWSLRNQEVYGHWGLTGETLGQNLYWGVNEHYQTRDYPGTDFASLYDEDDFVYRAFLAAPEGSGWQRSEKANVFDRSKENRERAWEFTCEHPGFVLRSRCKRVADALTPASFLVRLVREDTVRGWWTSGRWAVGLVLVASVQTALVLALGLAGAFGPWLRQHGRAVWWCALLGVGSTVPLVAMSRYRLPAEPLLLVAAAALLCGATRPWRSRDALPLALIAWLVLGLAWWINHRELHMLWQEVCS